jgi:hypothetical protein
MEEFIDLLIQQVDGWNAIEEKWNPCRRFIATSMKGGPVHLATRIWKQSLESILTDNFMVTSSSQVFALHLGLGTIEEIDGSDGDRTSNDEEARPVYERWTMKDGKPIKKEQPAQKIKKEPASQSIKKESVNRKIKKEPVSRASTRKSKPTVTRELLGLSASSTARPAVSRKRSFSHSNLKEEDVESVDLSAAFTEYEEEDENQESKQQEADTQNDIDAPPAERTRHRSARR